MMRLGPRGRMLLLALAAFAVYANTIPHDFAYDDYAIVVGNERVRDARLPELLSSPYWPWLGGEGAGLYRPATSLTYAVDWTLWGGRPQGFHLVNALGHAAVTVLLLTLLLRLFPAGPALAGAVLFAVHPVHTEAVANVVGRAEILAAGFVLASLLVLGDPRSGGARRRWRVPAAAGLFALGVLSKEGAIVLPGLLLVLDAARAGLAGGWRPYLRRRAGAYGALFLTAALVLAVRVAAVGRAAGADPAAAFVPDASFATRFFTMIRVWPHYVRLLLAPFDLSADYSPAVILPARALTPEGVVGLLLAAAIAGLGVFAWRHDRRITAGLAWVAIAILPVSNLFVTSGVVLAERTLYLPSAGLSLAVCALAGRAAAASYARWARLGFAGLIAVFAAVTVDRNRDWADSASIFNSLRRDHPESYVAHWVLATDLVRRGRWAEATRWYESAHRIWPHSYAPAIEMAAHLLRAGDFARAAEVAAQAARLRPDATAPWELHALALYRLGRFAEVGRVAEAAPPAVRGSASFAYVVAAALDAAGEDERSAEWRARVRRAEPTPETWAALYEIARLQLERGDTALAAGTLAAARRAARADPIGRRIVGGLDREEGDVGEVGEVGDER